MKTLTLTKAQSLQLSDTPLTGSLNSDEAKVRIRSIGICGTDIHSYLGSYAFLDYPRILGHELAVEIVELGSPSQSHFVGDLCAVEPYLTCGHCLPCQRGTTNCCESLQCLGVHTDGGMREYMILPVKALRLANGVDPDQVALVEMLGVGKHAVERGNIHKDQLTAIIGLGPIGLSSALFAKLTKASIVGVDVSANRCEKAKQLLGIECLHIAPEIKLTEQFEYAFGRRPDVVIDASGNQSSMQNAFDLPANGGTLVFVGLIQGKIDFNVPSSHRRELTTKSSRNCTAKDLDEIISLMRTGEIDVRPWISHSCRIEDFPDKILEWLEPKSVLVKAVIHC